MTDTDKDRARVEPGDGQSSIVQRFVHHAQQVVLAIRLVQNAGVRGEGSAAVCDLGKAGGQQRLQIGAELYRDAREFPAVHAAWHDDVGKQQIDRSVSLDLL